MPEITLATAIANLFQSYGVLVVITRFLTNGKKTKP